MNSTTSIFQWFYREFENALSRPTCCPHVFSQASHQISKSPPPSNLEKPLLSPMFSTENLGQTSMLVTSNFQRGKIQPKRFFFYYCYFLWLTHFLDLHSFLHELTIWTSAQRFCGILNIRETLPSSRENWFLLNTEDSSSVNLNSKNEFTKPDMSM